LKNRRQDMILELVEDKICLTQEDLLEALRNAGFDVTQSTVSRDIRELKLVKGRDKDGNYRYLPHRTESAQHTDSHYNEMFARAARKVDYALNNVVIKCYNGMASSACVALDILFGDMMLGSLAGDDTIIVVTRSVEESEELTAKLKSLLK